MKSLLAVTLIVCLTVTVFLGSVDAVIWDIFGFRPRHGWRNTGLGMWGNEWTGTRRSRGPWWQGPNICETRSGNLSSEFEISEEFFSSMPSFYGPGPRHHRRQRGGISHSWRSYCHDYPGLFRRCTHRLTNEDGPMTAEVTQQCCYGFLREEGDYGCPIEYKMETLEDTLISVGVTDFVALFDVTGVEREINNGLNYTIFAPINEAMSQSDLEVINSLVVNDGGLETLRSSIAAHVVPGLLTTSDMKDEQILTSIADTPIRMTYYPKSSGHLLVTANCAGVMKHNEFATNGIVHVIDTKLTIPTQSISEIIQTNPRFKMLRTVISKAEMDGELDKQTQITMFAPTNAAFDKMDPELLNSIIGDKSCLAALVENHVVPHTICSAAIDSRHYVRTVLNTKLFVNRTQDDKIFIKGVQVVTKDLIATNGVIHAIDQVLVPRQSLSLPDLLEGELRNLVEEADLIHLLQNTRNATIFAPTDNAIENLPEDVTDSFQDSQVLRSVLLHHVIPETLPTRDLGYHINDDFTALDGTKLRITSCDRSAFTFVNRGQLLVECVPIIETKMNGCSVDNRGCNGIIHNINKVIVPPSGSILETLKSDSSYSTMLRALEVSGLAEKVDNEAELTIFAPTNAAFEALSEDYLDRIMTDSSTLKDVLSYHIVEGFVCGGRLRNGNWWLPLFLRSFHGDRIRIAHGMAGLMADQSYVTKTDTIATNGVIHTVDKLMFPY